MKAWATAMGLGLAATAASAVTVEFNRNLLALSGQHQSHRSGIRFNTVDAKPLPHNILKTVEGLYGGSERIECSFSEETSNSGNTTVLIAISKCLNQSSIDLIEAWVGKIKSERMYYIDHDEKKDITFTTTLIPGQCQARSELENKGRSDEPSFLLSDGTDYRLSEQVLPNEVERIEMFAKFGRVLASMEDYDAPVPVAVIGFVNNGKSYSYISQYEQKLVQTNTFNFQICDGGESCEGQFENCVFLQESVDLFMYNPFQVTRSFQCSALDDGIPVVYVNEDGERQCFCACPAGSEMQEIDGEHKCVSVEPDTCPCTWSTHPFGFKWDNEENLQKCQFSNLASEWHLPVPFPSDNYVSDYRTNNKDKDGTPELGPHVDVVVTQLYSKVYDASVLSDLYQHYHAGEGVLDYPPEESDLLSSIGTVDVETVYKGYPGRGPEVRTHYTWKDYQQNRQAKIDDVTLSAYGKYELVLDAHDYSANSAQCVGCVSVVDQFRPRHTTECPVHFCDNTTSTCRSEATAELTSSNIARANGLVEDVFKFQSEATNDACSEQRCDDEEFAFKDFFDTTYTKSDKLKDGKKCFDETEVESAFKSNPLSTTNPLVDESCETGARQDDVPVSSNVCTRCCKYSAWLREFWTDYKCGYDYDLQFCNGLDSEHCDFQQCLVLTGDMVSSASASIKESVRCDSEEIIAKLGGEGFQPYTQIHRALQCSSFGGSDGECDYVASVSDLIDVSATNKYGGSGTYTFWRYKIAGDNKWRLWDSEYVHTFASAETKITVEAWTACGLARKFFFYVHLHPHNDIKVCDVFKQMWYQTSQSSVENSKLCAYPGSDFAELTFDYQPNIGLQYARQSLRMEVSGVECQLTFKDRLPVEILNVEDNSPEIIERFAIELQNQDETSPETQFNVTCTFTYTRFDNSKLTHTCPLEFTVTDCNGPAVDIPESECEWSDCAGQAKPGPFEACGGNVVRATATAGYMDTEETECCQGCGERVPSVCTPIFNLPDESKDIKRCEPVSSADAYHQEAYGNYDYSTDYYGQGYIAQAQVFMAKAVANHPMATAAMGLLVGCAMVAVVALVIVRRRHVQAAQATVIVEDAYYPLLY